ncbi:MAG: LysE family transporter [Bacteroidota bacterium]|nr:LysE family transporter [Bacteroidota bacterium]
MIALVLGFIVGFATSIPVGPINLAVMMKGLSNKTGQGLMIGAGSGFMDILYCGAAMFGISSLMTNPRVVFILQIATFFIFLFFGIKTTFFKIAEAKLTKSEDAPGFKRYFVLGVLLYLSNPSFIAYWITVAGIVHGYHILAPSAYNSSFFALGTGIGTTSWFFILLELVERQKMKLNKPLIERITRVFGVILLTISLVMGYKLIA